jgi:hypothetical protein
MIEYQEKRKRKLELGLIDPSYKEVFIKYVDLLKESGISSQDIYGILRNFSRVSESVNWLVLENIIGNDLTEPDYKLLFKKTK